MKVLRQALQEWYKAQQRDLPWRHTQDPYLIWLSEIILQQTRVDQGLPYYHKFTAAFPTVWDLANASQQEVLNLWQGLGYYSRGRNLHATAQQITFDYNGAFPTSYQGLLKLKGVGPYTAAAIASFAFNLPHAVVDGNVFRVLSRYFGVDLAINSPEGKRQFDALAQELLDQKNPALHNQAIMEFGALQCKPVSPNCANCPVLTTCVAQQTAQVAQLPIKIKKVKVRKRYFVYHLMANAQQQLAFSKRGPKDIWEGLYEFPLQEFDSQEDMLSYLKDKTVVGAKFQHLLTHQKIEAYFVQTSLTAKETSDYLLLSLAALEDHPIPRLIDKFLNAHSSELF
jgi:A/G-specific adenine glycosylase